MSCSPSLISPRLLQPPPGRDHADLCLCHRRRRPRRHPFRPVRPLRHLRRHRRERAAAGDPHRRRQRNGQRGPPVAGTARRSHRLRPGVCCQHRPRCCGASSQSPRAPAEVRSEHDDRQRPGPASDRPQGHPSSLAAKAPEPIHRWRLLMIRSLPLLTPTPPSGAGCARKGSCGLPSIGLDEATKARVASHPCYNQDAHQYYARMHLAVAPGCNVQCNYCNPKFDCMNESRPGVTSRVLSPEEALAKVVYVAAKVPQLSVVGIAGPGDPLANAKRTFRTFELIARDFPDLRLCLSTNGLKLPEHVDRIVELGIDHVTITMNYVDPQVGAGIYAWVAHDGKQLTGVEAAQVLLDHQIAGLRALVAADVLVKINLVMIPGINDTHLPQVARLVKAEGAFVHNVLPLISEAEHGTHFGLTGQRGPTAAELKAVQDACMGGANLMRHCRQCRADAVGLLGEDRSEEFTMDKEERREKNTG